MAVSIHIAKINAINDVGQSWISTQLQNKTHRLSLREGATLHRTIFVLSTYMLQATEVLRKIGHLDSE